MDSLAQFKEATDSLSTSLTQVLLPAVEKMAKVAIAMEKIAEREAQRLEALEAKRDEIMKDAQNAREELKSTFENKMDELKGAIRDAAMVQI